ncbi:MAG TPA: ferritin family protein [Ktedonobacterales bacterium]|nr:ferritin family protein [Ktedonobacterales bacterium]
MNTQTRTNLLTAMHGEAFAYAKYMLFAEHARQEGQDELARLFTETAHTELFEHFAEEAKLAALDGTTSDNLQDAIGGETYEVEIMYRTFADQARAAGDEAAAERFTEILHDELGHRDAFKAALQQLEAGPAVRRLVV